MLSILIIFVLINALALVLEQVIAEFRKDGQIAKELTEYEHWRQRLIFPEQTITRKI